MKNERGITLVALVITIIILLILAGISISALTNTGIFKSAKDAKAKSEEAELEQNTKLDEYENEIDKYIPKEDEPQFIDKTKSYVGCYIKTNKNGPVDGIIYADLAVGNTKSGVWGNDDGKYTIPKQTDLTKIQDYVIQGSYTTSEFGAAPVLVPVTHIIGNERFFVMALKDASDGRSYDWYNAAIGKISDYNVCTSTAFGSGLENTKNMMNLWNATEPKYGNRNACKDHDDVWSIIDLNLYPIWFIPSKEEWAAFAGELEIDIDNYKKHGLGDYYWSSSLFNEAVAWRVHFFGGLMHQELVNNALCVRLSAKI